MVSSGTSRRLGQTILSSRLLLRRQQQIQQEQIQHHPQLHKNSRTLLTNVAYAGTTAITGLLLLSTIGLFLVVQADGLGGLTGERSFFFKGT